MGACRGIRWGFLGKYLVRILGKVDMGAKATWMRVYDTDNTYKQWGKVWRYTAISSSWSVTAVWAVNVSAGMAAAANSWRASASPAAFAGVM